MASSQDDSEWDKSTSEIASEDSDTLYKSRPNRWRGPPQSWRTITEEDRLTATTLDRLRNQDLAVHLYNAFALKHHLRQNPASSLQQLPWAPPKSWTAWPLQARLVPDDDFMKRGEDEDEVFTFRRVERQGLGGWLEEVVDAVVLRCAKEKFRERGLDGAEERDVEGGKAVKKEPVSSGEDFVSSAPESDDAEDEEDGAPSARSSRKRRKAQKRTYKPAIAIDDEVSYALIRPSTRAILAKLDRTLTILHNACATSSRNTARSASGSEADDDDPHSETSTRSRTRTRSASRSRDSSRAPSIASLDAATPSKPKPKSTRGRKSASMPRDGESERDFLLRRAREQKKKRPVFSEDENDDAGATTDARSPSRRPRRKTRRRRKKSVDGELDEYWLQKKLDRFHLRDWSDVMGAAALAGFDARVIARATQRCANLFGQGMEMHTIDEHTGVSTRRFVPGQVVLSSESENEEDENDRQSHAPSGRSSIARSRAVSLASEDDELDDDDEDDDDEHGSRGTESARKRRRRSSSRGSMLEACYCPHTDCDRHTRSFSKPFNLRRHLQTVHGEESTTQASRASSPRKRTPRSRTPLPQPETTTPQAEATLYCTHADCERATRPFDKRHNLKRHLELVHGEGLPPRRKGTEEPAGAQYFCSHADCERATRPFDKRHNLRRHLELVHGGGKSQDRGEPARVPQSEEAPQDAGSEVSEPSGDSSSESEDES